MTSLKIQELLPKRVLTSRDSARSIAAEVADAVRLGDGGLEVDLQGVLGMAPSFFDELLSVIEKGAHVAGKQPGEIIVSHPPSALLAKHHLVCKGHGLRVSEDASGRWVITQA